MTTKRSILAFAALLWPSVSLGDQVLSGDHIQIYYGSYGTWNSSSGNGFQFYASGAWQDMSFPGSPWQHFALEFDHSGSSYSYAQNYSSSQGEMNISYEADLSDSTTKISWHEFDAGPLEITKVESWDVDGQVVHVHLCEQHLVIGCGEFSTHARGRPGPRFQRLWNDQYHQ